MSLVEIVVAEEQTQFEVGRTLVEEYAAQLGVDLCFQDFAAELEQLPRMYGAPERRLLLARDQDAFVACVGVRIHSDGICELKRLYVRADARRRGLGRQLTIAAIDSARALGYRRMVLDTLGSMTAARALYLSLGFRPAPVFPWNAKPGVVYLERDLSNEAEIEVRRSTGP